MFQIELLVIVPFFMLAVKFIHRSQDLGLVLASSHATFLAI
jgi:hypothetical protein